MGNGKTLFLVNPRAGRGTGWRVWRRLEPLISGGPLLSLAVPSGVEETRRLAQAAVKSGYARVVAVGGDGTIQSVAGELAFSATELGVIPAGTGNDFCRNLGIPLRPEAALQLALQGTTRPIDLGQLGSDRYFANAAGAGFDAAVAKKVAHYATGLGGTLPYLWGGLTTLAAYRPCTLEVTVDGVSFSGATWLVAVANGARYGGGMRIAPQAQVDDGLLDVCIVGGLGSLELVGLLPRVYQGTHVAHRKVHIVRGKQIVIRSPHPLPVHLDGEPLEQREVRFTVRPRALRVVVPASVVQTRRPAHGTEMVR